jgi:hypothetical protein
VVEEAVPILLAAEAPIHPVEAEGPPIVAAEGEDPIAEEEEAVPNLVEEEEGPNRPEVEAPNLGEEVDDREARIPRLGNRRPKTYLVCFFYRSLRFLIEISFRDNDKRCESQME